MTSIEEMMIRSKLPEYFQTVISGKIYVHAAEKMDELKELYEESPETVLMYVVVALFLVVFFINCFYNPFAKLDHGVKKSISISSIVISEERLETIKEVVQEQEPEQEQEQEQDVKGINLVSASIDEFVKQEMEDLSPVIVEKLSMKRTMADMRAMTGDQNNDSEVSYT